MNRSLQPLTTDANFMPPADGFVHVQPYGMYPFTMPDGKQILLVIDEAAVDAQISSFNSTAAPLGAAFAGLLCDFDHQSCDQGQRSEAAAWVTALQKRADGLWAKMRWTDEGLSAIKGGRYRFTSNVHLPSDCVSCGSGKLRPMRVDRFALTNDPRMLQGAVRMQPISSRADPAAHNNTAAELAGQKGPTMDKIRTALIKILGLPDTATDEELLAAAEKFGTEEAQEEAHQAEELKSAKAEIETLKSRAVAAEKLVAGQKAEATLTALEGEGYKFTSRDEVKARLEQDHDGNLKFIRLQPPPAAGNGEALRSRKDAKTPDAAKLTPEQKREERERLIDEAQAKFKLRSRASAVARVQAARADLWAKE